MIALPNAIIGFLAVYGLAVAASHGFAVLAPAKHWFEYERVELAAPARAGQDLKFRSWAAIYRPVDMRWNDILYCDFGDGFFYFSYAVTSRDAAPPKAADQPALRRYGGEVPARAATCYLESTISIDAGMSIRKTQTIKTERFELDE